MSDGRKINSPPAGVHVPASAGPAELDALVALVARFSAPLARYFRRRVEAEADIADLVQDVFLRLARMPDLRAIDAPDRFLFVIAANVLRDRARRAAVREVSRHVEIDGIELESADFSPLRVLVGREGLMRVQAALRELPQRTRDVFVLRLFEEYRMADVASALGISKRAAEKHYARALRHLQAQLEDWRHH
ncbi:MULTISPECIES: RNA polymerase sigma factor [unclassified Sphingomonas]|uniref:RNA polymerase sigma factor n=1 Tax=unclassified Sphingomonas TaxID=196159 RepID=UPI000AFAEACB|nr:MULTISPECIES: sigma-70 family RNA polymerase sigma factor [unclassified Sphingomonas]